MNIFMKMSLEIMTMTKRNLWKSLRNPDRLMENIIAPIMTMLVFVYVMGGAMSQTVAIDYVNFIMPGILLLCVGQCSVSTAFAISTDLQKGMVDRFRAMPITTIAFLNGHTLEAIIRTIFSTVLVFVVSLIVGFRPEASFMAWVLVICLYLLFPSWLSAAYGLFINGPEGASSLTMFIMLFIYLSSGFIPTGTLPRPLQIFADNQPVTLLLNPCADCC